MEYQFSDRLKNLKGNAIREIFKLLSTPGIISFAGGFPAKETLPVDEIREIADKVLSENGAEILQYGGTEGYRPLIVSSGEYVRRDGVTATPESTLIVSGGQQGIDLTFKAFINKGDRVLVENPTYLAALHILKTYEGEAIGVDSDEDGINILDLAKKIVFYAPKILYLVPNFSNPSGKTLSKEKREAIYAICKKHGVIILEDNPYGDLRYLGEDVPTIKSLDKTGHVLYAGTFSKTLAPGLRVGYLCAPKNVIAKAVVCMQVSTVHTSILPQMIAYKFVTENNFEEHLEKLRAIYKHKSDLMLTNLKMKMPKSIKFTEPEGGLFIWGTLPDGDMPYFCKKAVQNKVAVVPGNAFLTDENAPCLSFRLNYSTPTDEQIEKGVDILAEVAKTMYR